MSPYAARFCSILGTLLVSGFGLKVFEIVSQATVPSYVFWAFGAFSVGAYCVFYVVERNHIENLCTDIEDHIIDYFAKQVPDPAHDNLSVHELETALQLQRRGVGPG